MADIKDMSKLDDKALQHVAKYFKALAEPMRLKVLNALQDGEKNVGQLTELSGGTQANISKHLSLLDQYGLVKRESRGNCVFYSIADPSVYELCELVCGQIGVRMSQEADISKLFTAAQQSAQ
ncbi:MAG: metalloregulator ArsR/SmtB family transcription factor [Methylotenera sp.]|jgi:DNA-binding transcriptional ArsR family regulator|uniref:ArsR/SmtB family transcription factor n=1 Tax=Methylotenera sp. TaxID=2051956 RepID=UPI00271CEF3F|nr:metalloregulator ArsR/SmtB family transcription factor [Methylotenera sp.]MDO9393112.1 metalloregulator ArsR/SmtB family transcription factor [Methylotenera sp.]MDP1523497.1 metalloregulator ArsR/SmtB family transcription factor [Methylotenera sp.]MDP2230061.1 metalloregulator ArsR/SmtB family transcription factor [Methylotenera sp.]